MLRADGFLAEIAPWAPFAEIPGPPEGPQNRRMSNGEWAMGSGNGQWHWPANQPASQPASQAASPGGVGGTPGEPWAAVWRFKDETVSG